MASEPLQPLMRLPMDHLSPPAACSSVHIVSKSSTRQLYIENLCSEDGDALLQVGCKSTVSHRLYDSE